MLRFFASAVVFVCSSLVGLGECLGDLILQPIGDRTWDIQATPGGLELNFRVRSDGVDSFNAMNAFSLGLRFVPVNGASGSLSIDRDSVRVDAPDRVFPNYNVFVVQSDLTQTFSADNFADSNGNLVGDNVLIDQVGRFLFRATVVADISNPLGRFDIVADPLLSGYFTEEFDELKFGNIQDDGSNTGVVIGTIRIAAVPEPNLIIGWGALLFVWSSTFRRRVLAQGGAFANFGAKTRPAYA